MVDDAGSLVAQAHEVPPCQTASLLHQDWLSPSPTPLLLKGGADVRPLEMELVRLHEVELAALPREALAAAAQASCDASSGDASRWRWTLSRSPIHCHR
jgi:hypothetical protein